MSGLAPSVRVNAPHMRNGFPFNIPRYDIDGNPFAPWDKQTLFQESSISRRPSREAGRYIPVYGAGALYCVKLTKRQLIEFYWRCRQFTAKIKFPGASFSASANISGHFAYAYSMNKGSDYAWQNLSYDGGATGGAGGGGSPDLDPKTFRVNEMINATGTGDAEGDGIGNISETALVRASLAQWEDSTGGTSVWKTGAVGLTGNLSWPGTSQSGPMKGTNQGGSNWAGWSEEISVGGLYASGSGNYSATATIAAQYLCPNDQNVIEVDGEFWYWPRVAGSGNAGGIAQAGGWASASVAARVYVFFGVTTITVGNADKISSLAVHLKGLRSGDAFGSLFALKTPDASSSASPPPIEVNNSDGGAYYDQDGHQIGSWSESTHSTSTAFASAAASIGDDGAVTLEFEEWWGNDGLTTPGTGQTPVPLAV